MFIDFYFYVFFCGIDILMVNSRIIFPRLL